MKKKQLIDLWLFIFRVCSAVFMMTHGYPKLMKFFSDEEIKFADPLGMGEMTSLIFTVFAEFICPIFIIIGYKTRYAALVIIITMLVAGLAVHGQDPFSSKEKALMYVLIFGCLAVFGSGKFSVNALLSKSRRKKL